jgi:8-oxo-dGTP pyrophosphatase MutT (NUDIX family)
VIEAAGGVLWRRTGRGRVKVLLVHRPRYRDWSLPKGKLRPRESAVEAAVREVAEETGLRCELGAELPSTRYVDRKGRVKHVRYWAMQPVGGAFHANGEVDVVRWVRIEVAAEVLSYRRDVRVVSALRDESCPAISVA